MGITLSGATATCSAYPPSIVKADTRWPGVKPDPSGADRTVPATSMPGVNGGSSRSWYSPRNSSRSGKHTPAAPTSTITALLGSGSGTSVYASPAVPVRACATSAFIRA